MLMFPMLHKQSISAVTMDLKMNCPGVKTRSQGFRTSPNRPPNSLFPKSGHLCAVVPKIDIDEYLSPLSDHFVGSLRYQPRSLVGQTPAMGAYAFPPGRRKEVLRLDQPVIGQLVAKMLDGEEGLGQIDYLHKFLIHGLWSHYLLSWIGLGGIHCAGRQAANQGKEQVV